MKRFLFLILAFIITFSLSACGASEKAQEKAAEKAIEGALGGNVKVEIDGEKYTYEDKDGNKMEVGGTEWPADEASAFIPKCEQGTVTACTIMGNIYIIDMEKVVQKDYDSYLQMVKDAGFTENTFTLDEAETEGYYQYQAFHTNGNGITLSYEAEEKVLQIMGTVAAEE